jgi:hypothetical protein
MPCIGEARQTRRSVLTTNRSSGRFRSLIRAEAAKGTFTGPGQRDNRAPGAQETYFVRRYGPMGGSSTQRSPNGVNRGSASVGPFLGLAVVGVYVFLQWQFGAFSSGCNGPARNSFEGQVLSLGPFALPVIAAIPLVALGAARRWSWSVVFWGLVGMAVVCVIGEGIAWWVAVAICNSD